LGLRERIEMLAFRSIEGMNAGRERLAAERR
jgi:hypothetical protein